MKFAHHGGMGALQDFDNLALGAAIAPDAAHSRQHPIAVHGFGSAIRRNEEVAGQTRDRGFGDHKAVAIAMHPHLARDEFATREGG